MDDLKKLGHYSLMSFVSIVAIPASHIIIRNHIEIVLGLQEAGYWQAIWYISTTYLMLVTTTLSVYYLPKLSELTSKKKIRLEILQGYKIILPIVLMACGFIYYFRNYIISIAFTSEFDAIEGLFLYQLIGDFLKIASWLFAYLFLAKALIAKFIYSQIVFSVLFVTMSIIFTNKFGLIGMTYAHVLNYFLYFFAAIYLTKKEWM
jgi:PST family polysaccharide transporter